MSYIALDYRCNKCGEIFESLEPRANPSPALPHCNGMAPRTMSCPMVITQGVSVTRSAGRSDPKPPGAIDTSAIADGQPISEWKAERSKQHATARRKSNRASIA